MGFTPREVDGMTLWEFAACAAGMQGSTGERRQSDVSEERLREMGIEGF